MINYDIKNDFLCNKMIEIDQSERYKPFNLNFDDQ